VDGKQGCLAALSKLKEQHPQIKTLLSVGGGSGSADFPAVAADFNCREAYARTAREFVDRFSLDGIDRKLPCWHPSPRIYSRSEKVTLLLPAS
jgi:chitinase